MAPASIRLAADHRHFPASGRARSKTDTAFRISCERPEITLNKLDQVSHQHFKDFAAFKLLPAPCDVQRQLCPSFDYSSHLYTPFNINSVVERRRPSYVQRGLPADGFSPTDGFI